MLKSNLEAFNCSAYVNSPFAKTGFYDEKNYLPLILPLTETYLLENNGFLVIGQVGVDGIVFGYRKNCAGIWAFYPVLQEYKWISDNLEIFIQDWLENLITL